MKHHLVYKVIHIESGKYYIGKHTTNNLDDGYMGSGTRLINAIKKYGVDSFQKKILFDFSSEEEALFAEWLLVTNEMIEDPSCYNMKLGGRGGWSHIDHSTHRLGRTHSEETKRFISKKQIGVKLNTSEEGRKKIIETNKNRIITDDFRKKMSKIRTGKSNKMSEEKRQAKFKKDFLDPRTQSILVLKEQGVKVKDIAEKAGISTCRVYQILKKFENYTMAHSTTS